MPAPFRRIRLMNGSGKDVSSAKVSGYQDLAGVMPSFPTEVLADPMNKVPKDGFVSRNVAALPAETRMVLVEEVVVDMGGGKKLLNWPVYLDDLDPEQLELDLYVRPTAGGFELEAKVDFCDGSWWGFVNSHFV